MSSARLLGPLFLALSTILEASTVALTSSANPATLGQSITLTATVSPSSATGTVTFYNGSTILGIRPVTNGSATFVTELLRFGVLTLWARYGGDSNNAPVLSSPLVQRVNAVPATAYATVASYPAGGQPLIGDFNGDGIADLVAANSGGTTLTVLLGNGNGTFRTVTTSGTGLTPVAIADFNGDGKADVLVTSLGVTSVLFGNGDGTFQSPISIPTSNPPVAVADFNGDGKADILSFENVTAGPIGTGYLLVQLGNGDGTFQAPVATPTGFVNSLAIADFNGDGVPDIVAIVYGATGFESTTVLLGNGDGTFRSPPAGGTGSNSPSNDLLGLVVGDFNGDGKPDFALTNASFGSTLEPAGAIWVFLGNGDGTFTWLADLGIQCGSPLVGDVNGDGKMDLVCGSSFLLGNGDGTFQPASDFTSIPGGTVVAVGQFNGDGRTDLVVSGGNGILSILLGIITTPSKLAFITQPSSNPTAGAAISSAVQVQDSNGNPIDTSTASITLTSAPAGISSTVSAVNGVATCNNLALDNAGSYTLTASSSGLASATTVLVVNPAAASKLAFATQPPPSIQAGASFSVTVEVQDAYGNVVTSSNAGVTLTSTPAGILTTATASSGQATFNNLTLTSPGTYSLTAAAPGLLSAASNSFTITSTGSATPIFSEIGIFRSLVLNSGAGFALDSSGTNNWTANNIVFLFGLPGDMPVAGNFRGDGAIEVGVMRCIPGEATCQWYIDWNNNGQWDGVAGGDQIWQFGVPGDLPVVGDWTGDGTSKIGIFRCPPAGSTAVCEWVLDAGNKHTYDPNTAVYAFYGLAGDLPVVNNWGVPGNADHVGVFRGNGLWIVDSLGLDTWDPRDAIFSYGLAGDKPVVGNWNGSPGPKKIGVFRPSGGYWVLNASGSNAWTPADPVGHFGLPGDLPVVGFWTQP